MWNTNFSFYKPDYDIFYPLEPNQVIFVTKIKMKPYQIPQNFNRYRVNFRKFRFLIFLETLSITRSRNRQIPDSNRVQSGLSRIEPESKIEPGISIPTRSDPNSNSRGTDSIFIIRRVIKWLTWFIEQTQYQKEIQRNWILLDFYRFFRSSTSLSVANRTCSDHPYHLKLRFWMVSYLKPTKFLNLDQSGGSISAIIMIFHD